MKETKQGEKTAFRMGENNSKQNNDVSEKEKNQWKIYN